MSSSITITITGNTNITNFDIYQCLTNSCDECSAITGVTGQDVSRVKLLTGHTVSVDDGYGYIKLAADTITCNNSICIKIIGISTPTPTPISTSTPTPTPTTTNTPTSTPIPPTSTPIPPTSTPIPPTSTPIPTATTTPTPTPTSTNTPTPEPTTEPLQMYTLVGPYTTEYDACVAGNLAGPSLGFTTFTNNNIIVGSLVYNNPFFGSPYVITDAPGWYAAAASMISPTYEAFRIDSTGTIVELGIYEFCILT
jgi:hypothetical protein